MLANVSRLGAGKGLAIHLLNYDSEPVSNVKVRLRLDSEFSALASRQPKLFTPDAATVKAARLERAGSELVITLERLDVYAVLTLEE